MNTNTNPAIILTPATTDTWATESGDVFTVKTGEFFNTVQNTSAYVLSTGRVALGLSERVFDNETNRLENEVAWANVFVSKEHARLFALELLAELERTENN